MNIKKNPKKNLERFKILFFVIGINLTLALVWTAFEWKQYNPLENNITQEMAIVSDIDLVQITKQIEEPIIPEKPEIKKSAQIKITDEKIDDVFEMFNFDDDDTDNIDDYKNYGDDDKDVGGEEEVFIIVGKMPSFPGGEVKMMEFLKDNIVYPTIAKTANITGMIYVSFIVEKDGSITNVDLAEGGENIGGGCLEESIRVVQTMPKWEPGEQRNNKVRVRYVLPVNFQLSR